MREHERVVVVAANAGCEQRTALRADVVLVDDENLRRAVEPDDVCRELAEHVVRDDEHRTRDEPEALLLHRSDDHDGRLFGADLVPEPGVARQHDTCDSRLLVRAELEVPRQARGRDLDVTVGARDVGVEGVVVLIQALLA